MSLGDLAALAGMVGAVTAILNIFIARVSGLTRTRCEARHAQDRLGLADNFSQIKESLARLETRVERIGQIDERLQKIESSKIHNGGFDGLVSRVDELYRILIRK